MYPAQSHVVIVGRDQDIPFPRSSSIKEIISCPGFLKARMEKKGKVLRLHAERTGRGIMTLETEKGRVCFWVAAFYEKEVFLITALSCNYHTGWNPELHDRLPHAQCCGPDKTGNALLHVKNMEKILHCCDLPVTWFLDPPTAEEERDFFLSGKEQYGDEFGFMPSSFSHFNPVNYNLDKTYEETLELVKKGVSELEKIFHIQVTTLAIDQFIGSVGAHFTRAASALGMRALWGMGFDHRTCDTSMFHGGCPWNPYRPDISNFRIPSHNPHPLWLFQWTFRDLINTVHTPGGASGAVMFSTDVDDILVTGIAAHQKDYYHRIAERLLKNKDANDMIVLTIHQEDHDSWYKEGLEYYEKFFTEISSMEDVTPATMGEVASWLDLKYPFPSQPAQCLRLEDPLLCKDHVIFVHPDVKKPQDWPSGENLYPPHVFCYNSDFQLIFVENSPTPFRYIDYSRAYPVPETGSYPVENLPKITILTLMLEGDKIVYEIDSEGDYKGFPFAVWTKDPPPEKMFPIPGGFVVFLDIHKGKNKGIVTC